MALRTGGGLLHAPSSAYEKHSKPGSRRHASKSSVYRLTFIVCAVVLVGGYGLYSFAHRGPNAAPDIAGAPRDRGLGPKGFKFSKRVNVQDEQADTEASSETVTAPEETGDAPKPRGGARGVREVIDKRGAAAAKIAQQHQQQQRDRLAGKAGVGVGAAARSVPAGMPPRRSFHTVTDRHKPAAPPQTLSEGAGGGSTDATTGSAPFSRTAAELKGHGGAQLKEAQDGVVDAAAVKAPLLEAKEVRKDDTLAALVTAEGSGDAQGADGGGADIADLHAALAGGSRGGAAAGAGEEKEEAVEEGGGGEEKLKDHDLHTALAGGSRGAVAGAVKEEGAGGGSREVAEALGSAPAKAASSLYDLSAVDIKGHLGSLSEYRGNVTLVVNVASACGYTDSNYQGLTKTYLKYHQFGLQILGFPCNQFGSQESGTEAEISLFCTHKYDVSFPMFSKVDVNGENAHPVYKFLRHKLPVAEGGGGGVSAGKDLTWNFNKILVDTTGMPVKLYGSEYDSGAIEGDIYQLLHASRGG